MYYGSTYSPSQRGRIIELTDVPVQHLTTKNVIRVLKLENPLFHLGGSPLSPTIVAWRHQTYYAW
jgi:hypothetical protein